MQDIRQQFCANLNHLMETNGYTPLRLARETEATAQAVSTWIKGKNIPGIEKLFAISRIFGTTVDALLADNIDGTEPKVTQSLSGVALKLQQHLDGDDVEVRLFSDTGDDYHFGRTLAHLLKCRSMSKRILAARLGVEQTVVEKWVAEIDVPNLSQLREICDILNVSMDRIAYSRGPVTCIHNHNLSLKDLDLLQTIAESLRRAHRKKVPNDRTADQVE